MSCLLCLENSESSRELLDKYTAEGQLLDVKAIILEHFWFQDEDFLAHRAVCGDCWELIETFHLFYLRVKSAHNIQNSAWTGGKHPVKTGELEQARSYDLNVVKIEVEDVNERALEEQLIDGHIVKNEAEFETEENAIALEEQLVDAHSCSPEDDTKEEEEPSSIDSEFKDPLISSRGKSAPSKRAKLDNYDELMQRYIELNCSLCGSQFSNFQQLKIHSDEAHKSTKSLHCCGQMLRWRPDIVDHILTHLNPKHFQCSQCEKAFPSRNQLRSHCAIHENNRVRQHRCDVCSKAFYRRCALKEHTILHTSEEAKTIACKQCEKKFANDYLLNKHIEIVHKKKYLYAHICDVCGKVSKGKEAWKRHQEEHNPKARERVRCQLCGFEPATKTGLSKHMRNIHSEENLQTQVCSICAKVSSSVTAHKRHVKYMHYTEPKHKCTMCNKSFKRLSQLREHTASHTGEILYTCPHCPRTYNSKSNWHSHIKKSHFEEWKKDPSRKCQSSAVKIAN